MAETIKQRRVRYKATGMCANCGGHPPIDGVLHCRDCQRATKSSATKLHARFKQVIFTYYGGRCNCCAESEPAFLSVDHINNDGNIQRKQDKTGGSNFYRNLAKSIIAGTSPNDLQLLCRNCNWGKHVNGGICPHLSRYI